MPLDLGRITHLLEQMHRSEDDSGDPIPVGMHLVTDGAAGFTWEDVTDALLTDIVTGLQDHGNLGSTETFDADIGTHLGVLDANCTFTLTGFVVGESRSMALWLTQDSGGGNTITLPAEVVNAAELEAAQVTTADSTSILILWSVDGGTNILGGWWGQGGSSVTLSDDTPLIESGSGSAGTSDEASRSDHVHPISTSGSGIGEILISDTPSTPLVFADLIQNEAQDDLVYADP
jgi:hypothetical protein